MAFNLGTLTVFGISERVARITERVWENGVGPMHVQILQKQSLSHNKSCIILKPCDK